MRFLPYGLGLIRLAKTGEKSTARATCWPKKKLVGVVWSRRWVFVGIFKWVAVYVNINFADIGGH